MHPLHIASNSNVIHAHFPKNNTGTVQKNTGKSIIASLSKKRLPIDMEKLRSADRNIQEFFAAIPNSELIELHLSGLTLEKDTFLMCLPYGETTVKVISLGDFISVMCDEKKLKKKSGDALEGTLTEMFDDIHIGLNFIYFSPQDLGGNQKIDTSFSLIENFHSPVYIPGEYFYYIKTEGDDSSDPRVSPEAILDESIRDPDLTLLIAHYMEQLYSDGISVYSPDTYVELIRYNYRTHVTSVSPFSLSEIIGCTLTEIRDRSGLLPHVSDPEKIVKRYLDRNMSPHEEAIIFSFPKKS